MLCQECGEKPATVHLTRITNGKKTELHLCESCAREKGELGFEPAFALQHLLAGLLNQDGAGAASKTEPVVRCSRCGMTYADFVRKGRLGCSHCYVELGERMEPLLRRIHGSNTHTGKLPRRGGQRARLRREVVDLRGELSEAVSREAFEEAARLRDRIRELEQNLSRG